MTKLKNPHPGEILFYEFILPRNLSIEALSENIGLIPGQIASLVNGNIKITSDIDKDLSRFFGTSEGFWLGLQKDYDDHT